MDTEKSLKRNARIYRKILNSGDFGDISKNTAAYENRLREMYASDNFQRHNIYPTTNTPYIYAVIAMCLEMKGFGLSDREIIDTVNRGFARRRNLFKRLITAVDRLPNSFEIARKWNLSDHEKRVKDGSITYDYFNVSKDKIEYSISCCKYVEMFETYGIRGLCKIFCMTDTTAYENLQRHVTFIRHSDLSDGDACHDEIIRKQRRTKQ